MSSNWHELVKSIKKKDEALHTFIKSTCNKSNVPPSWIELCSLKGSFIHNQIGSWTAKIDNWIKVNKNNVKQGLAPIQDIRNYYKAPKKIF